MIPRVKTGIPGLDSITQGGLVEGSSVLVTGETGTGKTIISSQYIHHGLTKGEAGVFITLEETPEDIKEDAMQFGWDFEKYEKKGLFSAIYHDPAQINQLGTALISELNNVKAKRVVIDSTSVMNLTIGEPALIRRRLYSIINTLRRHRGCTTIITSEIPEGTKMLSRFGVEEYVVDGVIVLNYLGLGDTTSRSLMIRKMRRTNHGKGIYPMEITPRGMVVKKSEL